MDIKICRLTNGAELLTEVVSANSTMIVFKNALEIVYGSRNINGGHITVTRFMPFADNFVYKLAPVDGVIMNDINPDIIPYYMDCLVYIEKNFDPRLVKESKRSAGLASVGDEEGPSAESLLALLKAIPTGTEH